MAAMDDTTINTSSSSTSHQTKMFAVFPILREFSDPNKKGGGSIDKNLYFLAADRPSDIVRKVRQQLVAAGIYGNAMEAMLALDTSPAVLLYQLLVTDQRVNHFVVSPETAQLIDDYFNDSKDRRFRENYLLWRSDPANIAEPISALPADNNGDLVLPEFHAGIAADAEETIPEKTLTATCSAATWYNAFQDRKIACIPYAAFKEATGDSVQVYKDTLRLLFQKHSPNSSRGRTGGSISAVQVETSLAGGHVGPQTDSESFVLLIDALRYFDACCHKVLEFWINKSKVPHLTQCFRHGNQPSALTQEPSRLLTEEERQHPLICALKGKTKEQLANICSALSGATEHNLGTASDTRSTMKKIMDFQTPSHVGPVASARNLENLVAALPPQDAFSISNQLEVFVASFEGHTHHEVAVQSKLEVADAANKGEEYPTLSIFAQSVESLGVAKQLVLPKKPKSKKNKNSNSPPPETANLTQPGGRGSGRKGGKGTGGAGGGGNGKGEKGGRRALDCYYCQSPVARSPSPGECSGPNSCKWAHHFKALGTLLIKTDGQLPPGLGDMLKGKNIQTAYHSARKVVSRHHRTPSDSDGSSSSETDDGFEDDAHSTVSRRSKQSERSSNRKSSRKKRD